MAVATYNRVRSLAGNDKIVIILEREHQKEIKSLFKGQKIQILAEPFGRNTAACIGLGAIYARHVGYSEPLAFLPSDHHVSDIPSFIAGLKEAARLAASGGIVTLGIVPTWPSTSYGYIQAEKNRILSFVEKPDLETARRYLQTGNYFWNAGIFVATPEMIINEIKAHLPELHRGLERLNGVLGTKKFETEIKKVYGKLESISFDYGIMEKTTNPAYVIPCDCGWSDVGSWQSLYNLKEQRHDDKKNLTEGETILMDCNTTFVSGRTKRLIACLGMKNCLVVDTDDALLVADLNKAEDVRKIVENLKKMKKTKSL